MKICKKCSFSQIIRWRIRALRLLLVLMIVYMVVIGELGLGDSRMMTSLAESVSRIIFFGGMIWVICRIVQNKKLLRNQWQLKQKLQQERDERNRYLHERSGGVVWDVLFVCLLLITLTASLTSMPAFYTSLTILVIAVILKAAVYFICKACA